MPWVRKAQTHLKAKEKKIKEELCDVESSKKASDRSARKNMVVGKEGKKDKLAK